MKKSIKTDCKKIEKMIPKYLTNKLTTYEMLPFLEHVKNCPECREEVTIQYMVTEGLSRAEIDNDYDLLAGFNARINESYKQIKAHDVVFTGFVFCIICLLAVIGISVYYLILH